MVKSENFCTLDSVSRMINRLLDEGKRYIAEVLLDFETPDDKPIAYIQITWIEE